MTVNQNIKTTLISDDYSQVFISEFHFHNSKFELSLLHVFLQTYFLLSHVPQENLLPKSEIRENVHFLCRFYGFHFQQTCWVPKNKVLLGTLGSLQ